MRTIFVVRAIVLAFLLATAAVPTIASAHGHSDDEHGHHIDHHEHGDVDHRDGHQGDHDDGDHGDHHDVDRQDSGGSAGGGGLSSAGGFNPPAATASTPAGADHLSSPTGPAPSSGDSTGPSRDNRITICHVEYGMVWLRKTSDPKAQYLPRERPDDLSSDFLPDPVLGCGPTAL